MTKRNAALLAAFLVFALAMVGVALLIAYSFTSGSVSAKTILEVDFETAVFEYVPPDPIAQLMLEDTPTVLGLVEALKQASTDDRVAGLIARVGQGGMGIAQLQEVRDAILEFRAAGKPAYAFAETFGEVSPGNSSYYLATAFDKIFLQQSGDVNLTGVILESQFVRGLLDKIGVEPRMDHRHEYKSAKNMYTETGFTEAHRESTEVLLGSIFDGIVDGMAEGRGMEPGQLRELIAIGPFYGQEAVDQGLVDALAYRDEAYSAIRAEVGGATELLYLKPYLERAGRPWAKGSNIALIYGVGGITRGPSQFSPLTGAATMGSDTVAAAFRAAIADRSVQAILFRIDCNGGSYVASDAVLRETLRAQEAGKPVIVSMGNVAASGGYFVALSADKIVAQPGTITASIGVLGGKMVTSGLWEKLGISYDHVESSDNASMWSSTHDYSDAEWDRHSAWLDRVYEDFTTKVAEGRGIPIERMQDIAKGRVWTGTQAKELGLVDELGGYTVAIDLARQAAGLGAGAPVELKIFPRPQSPWESLFNEGPSSSETATLAALRLIETLRPAAVLAQRLGLIENHPKTLALPSDRVPRL